MPTEKEDRSPVALEQRDVSADLVFSTGRA